MQQREKPNSLKPRVPKELRIDSTLSYQKFKQKGYRVLPKLAVKFSDKTRLDQSLSSKTVRKIMLVKIFQKIKFIRDLDLAHLFITEQNFYSSKFRYISKRLSNTSGLSLYDYRELKNEYKGIVTYWPKYMKRLQSLTCKVDLEKSNNFGFNDQITLTTDYLRYARGLKVVKVTFPFRVHGSEMDGIWNFKRYPPLIEKLSLCQAVYSTNTLKTSLEHFKKLKDFEINFVYNSNVLLMKNVLPLISPLSQLEILNVNFVDNFEIGPEECAAIKRLSNLKKVKLRLSVEKHPKNLQILEALEDYPLKAFCLNVVMKDEEETDKITRFLQKKKNSLEHLKLRITKVTLLDSSDRLVELINAIDSLPNLANLNLSHKVSFVVKTSRDTILPELDLSFKSLFSKQIPMKKFKVALNQFRFSHEGLMNILESLEKNSSVIEKITIDIAKYNIKTKQEVSSMLGFIGNLKNIRSLKLFGMGVPTKPFFSELIDVVCALKYLRVLFFGEVSAKVTQATFVNGVEKVLLKYGMEKFICETSADFKKALEKKTKASPPDIDLEKIKSKNPYLENKPSAPIYTPEDRDTMWKVVNQR